MSNKYAFDKSERKVDADGRLHVSMCPISKECVNHYYGSEIPGYKTLGLDESKIYKMYRPGSELKKAADTFNRIQILDAHEPVFSADSKKELVIGTTGSDCVFDAPFLKNSLSFWDDESIAKIETADKKLGGAKELSSGYGYTPVMTRGVFDGIEYDGLMTNIVGNHVALVESGRAGSDVKVLDSQIVLKNNEVSEDMKIDKKAKIEKVIKAMDIDLDEHQKDVLIDKLVESDADNYEYEKDMKGEDEYKKSCDEDDIIESLKMRGLDAEKIAKIVRIIQGEKDAEDEGVKEDVKRDDSDEEYVAKEEMKKALDSMSKKMTADFLKLENAKDAVRGIIGDVSGVSQASEVYRLALDSAGVSHKNINELSALETMCSMIKSHNKVSKKVNNTIALDSKSAFELFPSAARIGIERGAK